MADAPDDRLAYKKLVGPSFGLNPKVLTVAEVEARRGAGNIAERQPAILVDNSDLYANIRNELRVACPR